MHLYKRLIFILAIGLCHQVKALDFLEEPSVDRNLNNKVVLVTGSSGDIGRGISKKNT